VRPRVLVMRQNSRTLEVGDRMPAFYFFNHANGSLEFFDDELNAAHDGFAGAAEDRHRLRDPRVWSDRIGRGSERRSPVDSLARSPRGQIRFARLEENY
jgi:hypothetical protein